MSGHLSWLEAGTIGVLQGVTELFPVSSLGHSVLIPALIGGSWKRDLNITAADSPYLAFIVGLHVATALALVAYFWRDWLAVIGGLISSVRNRRIDTEYERLAWLLIAGTVPVGLAGLALDHALRSVLAKPVITAGFLTLNGLVLFAAEHRKEASIAVPSHARGRTPQSAEPITDADADAEISRLSFTRGALIGGAQALALLPGISRSGVTMSAGLSGGLRHVSAARFSFLLATPVILAAGIFKLPELAGHMGDGIRAQVLFGSLLSGIAAYLSVRFLSRYFEHRSLRPFGWYCLCAGVLSLVYLLS